MRLISLVAAVFWLIVAGLPARAEEAILNFDAAVTLRADQSVDVVENITVRAEGYDIRRGIFRDIPTTLRIEDENGNRTGLIRSNLQIVQILRDGKPEPYRTESVSVGDASGTRIYIGDADVFLSRGNYRYTIHYTMTRMGRTLPDYDELYWNVTGEYWAFPINRASATVTLPQGAVIEDLSGYTGASGSTEQAVSIQKLSDNSARFSATRPLRAEEGLTISATFQKGILQEPQGVDAALNVLSDYRDIILPLIALLVVGIYYYSAWDSVGRDPAKGTIIPRFHAPKGLSPALTHYIWAMGWRQGGWQAFSAALVSLATKGLISIDKQGKEVTFKSLVDVRHNEELPPGEAVIEGYIRAHGEITVDKSTGPGFDSRRGEFISVLQTENRHVYFKNNTGYVVFGVVLSVAALATLLIVGALEIQWMILAVFLGVIGSTLIAVFNSLFNGTGVMRIFRLAIIGFVAVNFVINAGTVAFAFDGLRPGLPAIIAGGIVVINIFFAVIMRAPTLQGRKLMDEIDGFRMYMETAEQERLNLKGEPEMTTKRFEAILPYAIALGVEKPWSEYFQSELARHAVADAADSYSPGWYHGSNFSSSSLGRDMAGLASGMSAAMIAAQPASSSSSGGGGGGSSGGGGGGGGGGGW